MKKLVLRLPQALHEKATSHTKSLGISLNSFFVDSIDFALNGSTTPIGKAENGFSQTLKDSTTETEEGSPCELCKTPGETKTVWEEGEERKGCFECVHLKYGKRALAVWRKMK
jgi:hypothetical protein